MRVCRERTEVLILPERSYESPGYSMNPSEFIWSGSNDSTYQTLWYICLKLSQRGPVADLVRNMMKGRTSERYTKSRGSKLVSEVGYGRRLADEPEVSSFFTRLDHDIGALCPSLASESMSLETLAPPYVESSLEEVLMRNNSDALSAYIEKRFIPQGTMNQNLNHGSLIPERYRSNDEGGSNAAPRLKYAESHSLKTTADIVSDTSSNTRTIISMLTEILSSQKALGAR